MQTNREWLERWAERWVRSANVKIAEDLASIADVRNFMATARPQDREGVLQLIEDLNVAIESVRLQHHNWRRFAEQRWGIIMPDLDSPYSAEPADA
jgi:hypothetical protein